MATVTPFVPKLVTELRELLAKAERGDLLCFAYVSAEKDDERPGNIKFVNSISDDVPSYEECQYPMLGALTALTHAIAADAVDNTPHEDR